MTSTRHQASRPGTARGATLIVATAISIAACAGAAAPAAAQVSMPSITAPKQAAMRAAAAANAHTAAMQDVDGPPPAHRPAAAPAPPRAAKAGAPIPVASRPVPGAAKGPVSAGGHEQPVMSVASHAAPAGGSSAVADAKGRAAKGKAAPAAVAATGGATPGPGSISGPAGPSAVGDTAGNSISVTQRGVRGEVSLNREVFSYDPGARRDPFISLMRSGDLRPMLSDLRLSTVLYDATGRNSIAVMRDQSTKDQYRVRVGMTLGRMRVVEIQPKQVVFTIEEVGFSRQEALALGDTTKARTP